jgi:fructose-1,6-bisphosphatase II / sedoheptulose-1,7-bisphosphatase
MGSGGAPQGVLAAAGLKCLGGAMQCRLRVRGEADRAAARAAGIDPDRKYDIDHMVRGEVMFAATGITDGHLLKGVRLCGDRAVSHSLVMRSLTATTRLLTASHDLTKSPLLAPR